MVRLSSLGVYGGHHSSLSLHSSRLLFFFFSSVCGRGAGPQKNQCKGSYDFSFHETPPSAPGGRQGGVGGEVNASCPPTVVRESSTVKKHEAQHKTDTKQRGGGKEKQREEEVQLTTQRTLHKKERQSTHQHHIARDER